MELRWRIGTVTTCFIDVESAFLTGTTGDRDRDSRWQAHLETLHSVLTAEAIDIGSFFATLLPISARSSGMREIADMTLTRIVGRDRSRHLFSKLAGPLSDLLRTYEVKGAEDLELKSSANFSAAWLRQGRPLLNRTAELTEANVITDAAEGILVADPADTASRVYAGFNLVVWSQQEDMDDPDVAAKLVWFVARLNQDLPKYTENLNPSSRDWLPALALIPPVLAARPESDFEPHDVPHAILDEATNRWLPLAPEPADRTAKLHRWWQTYCHQRPAWETALVGLDRLLSG